MIIDLQRFIEGERGTWAELQSCLDRLERDPEWRMSLTEVRRFHYLYERTSADLAKITTFASEPETRRYLESVVARAYCEIHESRRRAHRLSPLNWFLRTLPSTFRRHARAFALSVLITLVGCAFGGLALALDPEAKAVIMPFSHLSGDPKDRVAQEEQRVNDRLEGSKGTFSAFLMTHNTKVSILALGLGMTFGVGTIVLLFYNGVILGAVCVDYVLAGESAFLAGWLLPHGAIEIPAILIAGQAGLVLAGAMIGRGTRLSLGDRMRAIGGDLMTLIFGVACLLVWAGIVEAFFSQYHEPVIPYVVKILFGVVELILLTLYLWRSGTTTPAKP